MGSKDALKLITIIMLILATLSALVLASSSASLQETTAASVKTQELFSLLQESNSTVTEIFSRFQTKGEIIPQACLDKYTEALALAEESKSLLQESNYSEANSKIIQALQALKEALRIAYMTIPEQPTETETGLERAVQLRSSITRYFEQLQRIENLTRLVADVGYNRATIENQIQTVKSLLEVKKVPAVIGGFTRLMKKKGGKQLLSLIKKR